MSHHTTEQLQGRLCYIQLKIDTETSYYVRNSCIFSFWGDTNAFKTDFFCSHHHLCFAWHFYVVPPPPPPPKKKQQWNFLWRGMGIFWYKAIGRSFSVEKGGTLLLKGEDFSYQGTCKLILVSRTIIINHSNPSIILSFRLPCTFLCLTKNSVPDNQGSTWCLKKEL